MATKRKAVPARKQPAGPTPEQKLAARILLARTDFEEFVDLMHEHLEGVPFQWQPVHVKMAEHFTEIFEGRLPQSILTVPPRSGKTEMSNKFVAWSAGRCPDSQYVLAGYSSEVAIKSSARVQQIMQSELYARVFPGVGVSKEFSSKERWQIVCEGSPSVGHVTTGGPGGSIQGTGFGKHRAPGDTTFGGFGVVDDPVRLDDARSAAVLEGAWTFFEKTFMSRRNGNAPALIIGQRVGPSDPTGRVKDGELGTVWHETLVPVLDEHDRSCWPAQYPVATYQVMREAQPSTYWCVYQGQPRPPEGSVFHVDDIHRLEQRPALPGAKFYRGWDLAWTASKTSADWTTSCLIAVCNKHIYICEVTRGRWEPHDVEREIQATARRDGPAVTIVLPQDPSAGKSVARNLTALLTGYIVTIVPSRDSKFARAQIAAAQTNVGNVSIIEGTNTRAFLDELANFSEGVRVGHDDMVDAFTIVVHEIKHLGMDEKQYKEWLKERHEAVAKSLWFIEKGTPEHAAKVAELYALKDEIDPEAAERKRMSRRAEIVARLQSEGEGLFDGAVWTPEPDGWLPPGYIARVAEGSRFNNETLHLRTFNNVNEPGTGLWQKEQTRLKREAILDGPFAVIGLKRGATRSEVKVAGRAAMQKAHPDREGGSSDAFIAVRAAIKQALRLAVGDPLPPVPPPRPTFWGNLEGFKAAIAQRQYSPSERQPTPDTLVGQRIFRRAFDQGIALVFNTEKNAWVGYSIETRQPCNVPADLEVARYTTHLRLSGFDARELIFGPSPDEFALPAPAAAAPPPPAPAPVPPLSPYAPAHATNPVPTPQEGSARVMHHLGVGDLQQQGAARSPMGNPIPTNMRMDAEAKRIYQALIDAQDKARAEIAKTA